MADSAIPTGAHTGSLAVARRLPVGAEPIGDGRAHFRVWAPAVPRVRVAVDGGATTELKSETGGYFSGVADGNTGARYKYLLGDDERGYPDPASRFQPEGPHGSSEIVDPAAFEWSDDSWRGVTLQGQVLYELHVGTFTR